MTPFAAAASIGPVTSFGAPTQVVLTAMVAVLAFGAVALWPVDGERLPGTTRRTTPPGHGLDGDAVHPDGLNGEAARSRPRAGPWRAARGPARQEAHERALADLVAALAAPLRAGVPPAVAVVAAAPVFSDDEELGPLLRDLADAAARGAPVAPVWRRHARKHASPDLSFIGQAWRLSELTGAPLADALTCGEQVMRARARARERLSAAAAGPKASMAVLCLLPASGPVVGAVMGVDPVTLYFSSPVATGSLALGVGLGLAAWWWSRRILRRAA